MKKPRLSVKGLRAMLRKQIALLMLTVSCCVPAAGCVYDDKDAANVAFVTESDDSAQPDDDEEADDTAPELNVVVTENPGAEWSCRWPETCIWDYLRFSDLAAEYSEPVTEEELLGEIADIENGLVEPWTERLPEYDFRNALLDAMNVRFLVEDIEARRLDVTIIDESRRLAYRRTDLLFTDPYVGTFEGILLTPLGRGPFPAVVAVHGHRDDADIYLRRFHGKDFPAHGLAILMLTMRGMGIDWFEHNAAKRLLLDGFPLIGMRVYESLLGFKYLRYREDIDHERIGLIGHSGGSVASNLTIRLETRFAAYVSDLAIDYSEWGTLWEPWHCETAPMLFPYHLLIRDFSTSTVPVLEVPYGYTNGMEEIFDFFAERIGD